MTLSGNKGEWSEVYVLLKLLSDGCLHLGDADLKPIEDIVYPIVAVLREYSNGWVHYIPDHADIHISKDCGGEEVIISVAQFTRSASQLFEYIQRLKGSSSMPELEDFLSKIHCLQLKAKSSSKADIHIQIHDPRIGVQPTLGFSIKSRLGNSATLLNASGATNFVFTTGLQLTQDQQIQINSIEVKSKIQERIFEIEKLGGNLVFERCEHSCFQSNLMMIDTMMPLVMSEVLKLYYSGKGSRLVDLLAIINQTNPLDLDLSTHHFYEYKIKKLLVEIALGLQPNKVWDGVYDATGGYIVVKETGDLICYHFYDRNLLEDYLLRNTKLDTPSSSRHGFGTITSDNRFKLNLQIRFI